MEIRSANLYSNYTNKSNPNFGMAVKFTKEGKQLLEKTLLELSPKKQTAVLSKINAMKIRQEANPIDITITQGTYNDFCATVSEKSFNAGFWEDTYLYKILAGLRVFKRAEKYADKLNKQVLTLTGDNKALFEKITENLSK